MLTITNSRVDFTHDLLPRHVCYISIMGVTKMGNIAARAGIKLTSLAFQVSVLTLRLPDVTIISMPTRPSGSLPDKSVQTTTVVA